MKWNGSQNRNRTWPGWASRRPGLGLAALTAAWCCGGGWTWAQEDSSAESAKPQAAAVEFAAPVLLTAGGEPISVETPGYACPTMADVDNDGVADLVVGQFRNGNMQFFKNLAASGETPRFAAGSWLQSGDDRLTVPGVW